MSDIYTLQVTGTLVPSIMFASLLSLPPKLLWVAHSAHSLFHSSLGILSSVASTEAPVPPHAAPPHPMWCESPLCPELGLTRERAPWSPLTHAQGIPIPLSSLPAWAGAVGDQGGEEDSIPKHLSASGWRSEPLTV